MASIRRTSAVIAGPALALLLATSVAAGPGGVRNAKGTFVDATGRGSGTSICTRTASARFASTSR